MERTAPRLEVCVDSVEAALAAEAGGADRVELCAALVEGGLTPSAGLLEVVRRELRIAVAVMIRPRGGDFCYSDHEFEVMRRDLIRAKSQGADLLVFGLLNPDGTVDRDRTAELVALARPLPVTFHRAFDMTRDAAEALETLAALGMERVLTSGQERSALEGLELITALIGQAAGRVVVMPGGGITERNVKKILQASGAREFHVSAGAARDGRMEFRNTRVFMGAQFGPSEFGLKGADEARVRAFRGLAG